LTVNVAPELAATVAVRQCITLHTLTEPGVQVSWIMCQFTV